MADVTTDPWGPLEVVTLEGSPYQRGLAHGRLLRDRIGETMSLWEREYVQDAFGMHADDFALEVERQTDFYPEIKRWTPELLDELKGIADGSGVDFRRLYAFNLADECYEIESPRPEHCSSIAVWPAQDGPALAAQSLDIEPYWDGHQLLQRHVDEDGTVTLVSSYAGCIGMNGMNSHGVGVCMNSLSELRPGRSGLPVTMVIRGALRAASAAEAAAFLAEVPHATGQNYVVAGRDGVRDLECSAGAAAPYMADQTAGVLMHTNSPLVSDDYAPGLAPRGEEQTGRQAELVADSAARMRAMAAHLPTSGSASVAEVIRALRCVAKHDGTAEYFDDDFGRKLPREHMRIAYTFITTVMELGRTPRMLASSRPWESDEFLVVEC
jgi:hypothetical protein